MTIGNDWKILTIVTKSIVFDVCELLDYSLRQLPYSDLRLREKVGYEFNVIAVQ